MTTKKGKGIKIGKKKKVTARMPGRSASRASPAGSTGSSLDKGAMDHLRMLGDPCGAPLGPPVYPGLGSSNYIRTRTLFTPGPAVVDSVAFFNPSQMCTPYPVIQYASVNSSGSAPANSYGADVAEFANSTYTKWARARCLAACLKIRYNGSVLNMQGQVARVITSDCALTTGTVTGTALTGFPSVINLTQAWPTLTSLASTGGEAEVRWLPADNDALWLDVASSGEVANKSMPFGNCVGLAVYNAPAGTINYELTAIWEVIPASVVGSGVGGDLVQTMRAPTSRNTVNHVLQAIGSVTEWATRPETMERAIRLGGSVYGAVKATSRVAATLGALML